MKNKTKGLFISIEGGDGSGKRTQSKILRDYLRNELKKDVLQVSFPRHGKASAYYASQYLNGNYGDANSVHADLASLTYALDRFASKDLIEEYLAKPNGIVVADRYVASNLAHQGTKFSNKKDRHEYYNRIMQTEYEVLGIPKPDINIVLLVPTALAQKNVDKKDASVRSYTSLKRDVHEADSNHLELAKSNYEELCVLYPKEFIAIKCTDKDSKIRSIDDIQQDIRSILKIT